MAAKENGEAREKISFDQASSMIAQVVLENEGVASLAEMPPISNGIFISNLFGKIEIDVSIVIYYGYNIPEISWELQEKIRNILTESTNLSPKHINIHIQGVNTDNVLKDE